MEAAYISIDLKSFYASAECVARGLDPLTAKLVVADEERTDKTICLAVSPALKAYGVPGRARLFEVYERLREVKARTGEDVDFIVARPRMGLYVDVSTKIYSIYLKYVAPEDIHVYSIDEVFIDASRYLRPRRQTAEELAMEMIREVFSETGITATAGLGTNLYLAKIAMDIVAKKTRPDKNGVRVATLTEESYRKLLWDHLPLTDFWQIGGGTVRKLEKLGVRTMGELARLSLQNEAALYRAFGVNAELLIDHAWGLESTTMADIKAYKPAAMSLSTGQVLSRPYAYEEARIVIREMAEELTMDLMEKGLVTDALVLHLGYDRENTDWEGPKKADHYGRDLPASAHGTANLLEFTDELEPITRAVLELFDRIVNRALTLRRLNIAAIRLEREGERAEQMNIFEDIKAKEKRRELQKAVLAVRGRYGKNALLRGHDFLEGATARERHGQIGGHRK